MFYPALFDYADDGITVTFPDIPEAITCGTSKEKAQDMAEDVLLCCVELYFEEARAFPLTRPLRSGETAVYLPESVYLKILLHNKMLQENINKATLARMAQIRPPEMGRILTPRHATKIDTIGKLLHLLGAPLTLSA